MLRDIGFPELLLIIIVFLVLFGGKKIPEMMRGLGSGLREFKKAAQGDDNTSKDDSSNGDKSNTGKK